MAAAQEDGFVSEDERRTIDGRLQRVAVLVSALLRSFEREVAAATGATGAAGLGATGVAADVREILAPAAALLRRRMATVRPKS